MVKKFNLVLNLIVIIFIAAGCVTQNKKFTEADYEKVEKEIEIGRAVFAKLAGKYGVIKDEKSTEYLNKFGKSLAMFTERQEIEYYFAVLKSDQVNAYALPGGYVLISLGALKQIKSPGELAGIIAHELGHINKKHVLKRVKIQTKFNFFETLARFIAGPRQIVTTVVNQVSQKVEEVLFIKGYDAADEYEADAYAVTLLTNMQINSSEYIRLLVRLKTQTKKEELENLDATHPDIQERINRMMPLIDSKLSKLKDTEKFKEFMTFINGDNAL